MKNIVLVLLLVLICGFVWGVNGDMGIGTEPMTDGSETYPYLIEDLVDFDTFADPSNAAIYWASGVHIKLMANIDLSGRIYATAIIAPDTDKEISYYQGIPFTGIFDGNDHTISNLTIDSFGVDNDYLGLFGRVEGLDTKIENLIVKSNITGTADSLYLGIICAWNYSGTISNCHTDGAIIGRGYYGGICGENENGRITNCSSNAVISGHDNSAYLGGLCGRNENGEIRDSYSTGMVNGDDFLGGLCGQNYDGGFISHCHAAGAVTSLDSNPMYIGGLTGGNRGTVTDSYAIGSVNSGNNSINPQNLGGLCGINYGLISNCYSTGTVTVGDDGRYVGGLCGRNYSTDSNIIGSYATGKVMSGNNSYDIGGLSGSNRGTIYNSYAGGEVSGQDENSHYIGGLCGRNYQTGIISNSYATGVVSGGEGSYYLGALCGFQHDSGAIIQNCFWDLDTSQLATGYNVDLIAPGTITNVLGKTTEQMQTLSTFTDAGWDFNPSDGDAADWMMLREKEDYPRLVWQEIYMADIAGLYGVDSLDFAELARNWFKSDCPSGCEQADIDNSGIIDLDDLAILMGEWLKGV